jgi:outer membrane protein assembly factor BamB
MDFWVRWEKMDWKACLKQLLFHIVLGTNNHAYTTPWYIPADRDIAFETLGNEYYGSIDVEIVKKIMSTSPICTYSPDCKITSTELVANNGMWVHTGNPSGMILDMANFDEPTVTWETIEPVGWTRFYGVPSSTEITRSYQESSITPMPIWTTSIHNSSNDFFTQGITVDNIIYASASNGELYALKVNSGLVLWNITIGMNPTKPFNLNGTLFIGSHEGLHKVDTRWMSLGTIPMDPIVCPPVGSQGTIYVGTQTGTLYAIDADSAEILWEKHFNSELWLTLKDNILYVASGKDIFALATDTGATLWSSSVDGPISVQPTIINDTLYVGSWDTAFHALDASTGNELWTFTTGWGIETEPVITEDQVVFGSHDGNIYSVDIYTGQQQWVYSTHSGVHMSPVLIDNYIITGSDDGHVYTLNKETGTPYWSFAPSRTRGDNTCNYFTTAQRSNLIIAENTCIFGSAGTIYCFNIN